MRSRFLRGTVVAVVGGALLVGSPFMPVATAESAVGRTISAAVGNTYGGLTSQAMPVVIEMTKDRREVVEATAALDLTCTSGGIVTLAPTLIGLSVTKKGRFSESFGPVTTRHDDGTTTDLQGRISGKLNKAKTRISGKSSLTATEHDATGAVTDTCPSGSVTWKVRQ